MATTQEQPRRGGAIEMYQAELKRVPASVSTLLSEYSHIPLDQQKEHIKTIRDQAYKSHPYPCLGRWRFLELDLADHPLYHSDILPALKSGSNSEQATWKFLDLGCCLAQDVRKLAFDGADLSRLYGADLRPEFIDMGYALFRDEDKLPRDHFIAPADVFDLSPETELSQKCDGTVGILQASAVFHLFDLSQQKAMAQRCLKLLDPSRKRVLMCGAQVGNINPSEYPRRSGGGSRFRHDEDSWREMWKEVVGQGEWKEKIRDVEVHAVMTQHVSGERREGEMVEEGNKHFGSIEEGFRWMRWWVWVEFAES
ncbi:hypothetical protein LTR10_016641 [Elasticomyces elasticus]|uniref:Methyltransferase domain-containing protein n=1 Tax=Exophiala sideris TaxID=1016849 RepID=A0ABR0JKF7_9EURO|nr:hypothetical protein LTR10_016641 [Elasticomyces elasticus]KAK5035286.1 hypothetical protein LTS07_002722 [Exophiala sideris]KAK5039362.1 hypothetical protein LTR13_003619 [Exophiala sideris]KAK5066210.1 hypothetical protein LTR69_002728 [Exophiala sideris]KAK5186887.1 hypothetical protein LTR44_000893 [Eurotiomycetes sp. CCFEE 6388]